MTSPAARLLALYSNHGPTVSDQRIAELLGIELGNLRGWIAHNFEELNAIDLRPVFVTEHRDAPPGEWFTYRLSLRQTLLIAIHIKSAVCDQIRAFAVQGCAEALAAASQLAAR